MKCEQKWLFSTAGTRNIALEIVVNKF
jgi:hypothetical protein